MFEPLNFFSKVSSLCLVIGLSLAGQSGSAETLKSIQQRGYLIVAVKENLYPLAFKNSAQQLQGFEIDVARRLAQELLGQADAIQLQPVANQDRLPSVLAGRADFAIARVTATEPRSRLVSFSLPYYLDGTALVTKAATVKRLADLNQRPVAALNGSSTIATVRYLVPGAKLVGVDSYAAAYSLLESGKVVAFAADVSVLSGWVQEYPQYHVLPTLLSAEPLCVVLPKGLQYDDLRRQVNSAIARWHSDGWLQQRAVYWGLPWANLLKDRDTKPTEMLRP
ncbi:transporter substrate-binding domain-containing protein [Trichocoleus sp. FACHB-46]|uniref:Transporter substrate-binding domain-containing protein n=1 Tax=Trichocoleus desertorum GB2-A4 TaxID=2933944 RepID=A0ABV0J2L8_9CYAN